MKTSWASHRFAKPHKTSVETSSLGFPMSTLFRGIWPNPASFRRFVSYSSCDRKSWPWLFPVLTVICVNEVFRKPSKTWNSESKQLKTPEVPKPFLAEEMRLDFQKYLLVNWHLPVPCAKRQRVLRIIPATHCTKASKQKLHHNISSACPKLKGEWAMDSPETGCYMASWKWEISVWRCQGLGTWPNAFLKCNSFHFCEYVTQGYSMWLSLKLMIIFCFYLNDTYIAIAHMAMTCNLPQLPNGSRGTEQLYLQRGISPTTAVRPGHWSWRPDVFNIDFLRYLWNLFNTLSYHKNILKV